jgi:NAD(P)H-dependent flavin oxidoreductase YrpB (nitropropane dioxygenase family)
MVSVYKHYAKTAENVAKMLDATHQLTAGVFGANFILNDSEPALAREMVSTAASHARVVEFFYTDPDPTMIEIVHAKGALACWQVGSREEAVAAVDAGCDFIIAQGIEAGGMCAGPLAC